MSDLAGAFGVVLVGAIFIDLILLVPLWGPDLVYRGQVRSAKVLESREAAAFSLVDGLVMFVWLGLANVVVSLVWSESPGFRKVIVAFVANGLVVLMWTRCRSFMWRRGVGDWRARALVQALLYPFAIYSVGLLVFPTILLLQCASAGLEEDGVKMIGIVAGLGLVLGAVMVFVLRYLFRWCLNVSGNSAELEH